VLVALAISQIWGSLGGIFLIIAHGFTSSGLFISVNIIYERSHSRRIILNKGLIYQRRRFIIFWFLLAICNIAAPPTLNFFSEVFTIIRIVNSAYLNIIPIFLIIIFTSGYSLIIFRSIRHGKKFFNEFSRQFCLREFLRLFLHLIWRLLLILTIFVHT
jgi:NADH:ubiquinone oxidoreductase subunit 4 (subunit M)